MSQALIRVPKPTAITASSSSPSETKAPRPLTEELVAEVLKGRGLLGWLRVARVTRVLGLLSLYLYLDSYDIRAEFNRRHLTRVNESTSASSFRRRSIYTIFDKSVRLIRWFVFRGSDGTTNKSARLEHQAKWLSRNLIGLGPTFIKIGQALGTRADLLPLPYVKELSRLQDQVPAFPTAEAFTAIERELGRPLQEAYAEID